MQTHKVSIHVLQPNEANPRTITDDKFKKLVNSLLTFPRMLDIRPIVVDKAMVILAGNMRHKALSAIAAMPQADLRKRLAEQPKFDKLATEAKEELLDHWLAFLGNPVVEVIKAEDLTDAEAREFIVKDNTPFGAWDFEILANEYDMAELDAWGLDLPDDIKIDANIGDAQDDDFEVPDEAEIKTDIKAGDIFQIGPHRLICGDCTKGDTLEKLFAGKQADMVVTDPPYNVDYVGKTKDALKIKNDQMADGAFYEFLLDFYRGLAAHVKAGGAWYVWHADSEGANFRRAMAVAGIPVRQCLIWVKNSMVLGRQDYQWKHEPCLYGFLPGTRDAVDNPGAMDLLEKEMAGVRKAMKAKGHDLDAILRAIREANDGPDYQSAHDPCLYGWKEGAAHSWYNNRSQTTLLEFDRPSRSSEHPTMKPVPLIGYQIGNSSQGGGIVADVFAGSGTTMVAAHQMGRIAYVAELDPKYCQVILDRMRKLDPDIVITKNGNSI